MKKKIPLILSIILLTPLAVFAYSSPGKPIGFVSDFAHVLSATDIASLDARLQSLKDSTGFEVAAVTIPSLGGDTIENYAVQLFAEWGIGIKGTDTGILVLVAPTEHEARIETGFGAEGAVTDIQAKNIVDNVMIPAFKTGDYAAGLNGGIDAISAIVTDSPEAAQYSAPSSDSQGGPSGSGADFAGIFFFGVIALNLLARVLGRTKSWWLGGVLGAIAGAIIGFIFGFIPIGIAAIAILTILGLIFDYFVSKHPPGSGGRGGMGGFWPLLFIGRGGGGFNSPGGFGGFGGGSSGGGGASGKW